jgi:transcriptional accessory protein Tex/SPT6
MHAEKASLVSVKIELTPSKLNDFRSFLEECYMDMSQRRESWNLFRTLVIKILVDEILNKELIKEIRDEIQQEAETFIIGNCKRAYAELLMTGPFQTSTTSL